ncbi:MAG: hypothetical protein AB8V23_04775 [Candidatus Midichloria sp.]|nr:hypothetical protein MHYMCMPSP_00996 [Hyalomma marginatum]
MDEGIQHDVVQGIEKGKTEGIQIGEARGKVERDIEIAKICYPKVLLWVLFLK